jgi:hypothetical protein
MIELSKIRYLGGYRCSLRRSNDRHVACGAD